MFRRWLQNLGIAHFALRRRFPAETLAAIDSAIAVSERTHSAEIRCAIETKLAPRRLYAGQDSAARARQLFASLGMWDTAGNNGVLLYVLLAEQKIEIVADRGFVAHVTNEQWDDICKEVAAAFAAGNYGPGVLNAVDRISALACRYFPGDGNDGNELPDRTVVL